MSRPDRSISWIGLGFKAVAVAAMIAAPLAGVWLASSLAAFANRATWLPLVAGLLLFPGLPLAWEGFSALRARKANGKRRFLTFTDRLILRTLAINIVFLAALLGLFPSRAFVAVSARGDWMLDGHDGPTAERARRLLLGCAGAVEWVYRASNDNPYRQAKDEGEGKDIVPVPVPVPTTVPAPVGTKPSSSPTPSGEPSRPSRPNRHPWPAEVHPIVVDMPREVEVSVASVGKYIAERESDPMLRVKALHDWVADRIAYDVPSYLANNVPAHDGDPDHVFRSRVGVCAGYARLLADLGKATGDEIVYITGDVRSKDSPMEAEHHAWNAARINGAWYLIDATWNAGYPKDGAFEKRYQTEYLFTPPEQFVLSHFPDDAKWQLLEHSVSRAEFFRRPVVTPAFIAHGLELRSPDRSQVSASGSLELTLANPNNVFLLVQFEAKGAGSGGPRVRCESDFHTRARCDFPATGTYDVQLFASVQESGTYDYVASVQVNARP
ncbi:MAG: hypothetical protein J0I07_19955 [Myxococcales bacterium]|nr:hypothetical protein [Myxococcales bacterium]